MKYGYIRDLPDKRDLILSLSGAVPDHIDHRGTMPPVYDQGQLGSCTANALSAALDYERGKQSEPFITPSRLFIYYNERSLENTIQSDAGASLRDGIKTVNKQGVCPEKEWPYTKSFKTKPTVKAYTDAIKYESLTYSRIPRTLTSFKQALVTSPFVFGFTVYESFENVGKDGIVPMPGNESVMGGHAVVAVGYDATHFICRNSWGTSWGDKGYFYMPFEYLLNTGLSSDFWQIQTVK